MMNDAQFIRRHGQLGLGFDEHTGAWVALTYHQESLIVPGGSAGFQLHTSDPDLPAPELLSTEEQALENGTRLRLIYALGDRYRVWQSFDLLPDRIERQVSMQYLPSPGDENDVQLFSATLLLDGLAAGDPAETRVSVPMARIVPGTPWQAMARRPRIFSEESPEAGYDVTVSAPDTLPGTVTLERDVPPLHLAVTPRPHECPVHLRLYGQDARLVIEQEFLCESWLHAGDILTVAAQVIHLAQAPWRVALPTVGEYLSAQGCAPPADRPAWANNAIIYEVDLEAAGGFRALTDRLAEIQGWGFNTLYLMPWHQGGYGTLDYQVVNPAYGTFDDLRALCDSAHARGMHVLFDLLSNIAAKGSPYLTAHPEWFYRDAEGKILSHPLWKSPCFDPAAPGFRQMLLDYTVRCCREWGADGFRVDAVAYRGGNWQNQPGLQPHQHAHAIFTLQAEIRQAIRAVNPDAILLAETFGPLQVPISDLVCWQWLVWLDWALDGLQSERLDGATLQRLIAEQFFTMPPGTWFTFYTHTHDTLAFLKRDIEGPAVSALFATLTFLGAGIMVFGGGWGMHPRPRPEEVADYRALFAAKTDLGGAADEEVYFPTIDDPALFVAERASQQGLLSIVTNFSDAAIPLPVSGTPIFTRLGSDTGVVQPYDTVVVRIE